MDGFYGEKSDHCRLINFRNLSKIAARMLNSLQGHIELAHKFHDFVSHLVSFTHILEVKGQT